MNAPQVIVFNGGSSSWKSALFDAPAVDARAEEVVAARPVAKAALAWPAEGSAAQLEASAGGVAIKRDAVVDRAHAVRVLVDAYREVGCDLSRAIAAGHRIVHGGPHFTQSVRIDDGVLEVLASLEPFAPNHNKIELDGIAAARAALPDIPQVAVFDTAFHRTMPPEAYTYGGPYEWLGQDIRRYGFHGINVAYCVERASALLHCETANVRLAVAHLGGGCSVTAVRDGASIDTTMGFTPLDGLLMGTRSGGIDPGIAIYLLRRMPAKTLAGDGATELDDTLNRRSGLLGLSGLSGDVRELLAAEATHDARATLALDVFVHRLAASIAATLPALGRLDAVVFSGGIGEHAAQIRERVCARLAVCGLALDQGRNAERSGDSDIADARATVRVLVVAAGEEWFIARECARVLVGTREA
jgi:acetate kinase